MCVSLYIYMTDIHDIYIYIYIKNHGELKRKQRFQRSFSGIRPGRFGCVNSRTTKKKHDPNKSHGRKSQTWLEGISARRASTSQ